MTTRPPSPAPSSSPEQHSEGPRAETSPPGIGADRTRGEPPADPALSSATSPRSVEGYRQVKQLVKHAVGVGVLLSTLGTLALLIISPTLAPWYLGTSGLILANAGIWSWIIRGAFRVEGASRALLVRGVVAKMVMLALVLTLVLLLRPISFPARMAVLAGLLTPLLGVVAATQLPTRPNQD